MTFFVRAIRAASYQTPLANSKQIEPTVKYFVDGKSASSFPGSSLFLPRESTLVSAGHLPTRVDSLFFKKRREKRMQIFSNSHGDRGMGVISSLFSKTGTLKKSTVYYLRPLNFCPYDLLYGVRPCKDNSRGLDPFKL